MTVLQHKGLSHIILLANIIDVPVKLTWATLIINHPSFSSPSLGGCKNKILILLSTPLLLGSQAGKEYNSPRIKYVRQVLTTKVILANSKETMQKEPTFKITFSNKDYIHILPRINDIMVITVQCDDWDMKRVLIDHGSL